MEETLQICLQRFKILHRRRWRRPNQRTVASLKSDHLENILFQGMKAAREASWEDRRRPNHLDHLSMHFRNKPRELNSKITFPYGARIWSRTLSGAKARVHRWWFPMRMKATPRTFLWSQVIDPGALRRHPRSPGSKSHQDQDRKSKRETKASPSRGQDLPVIPNARPPARTHWLESTISCVEI